MNQAVQASLIGTLLAAMFLSKTYFEVPSIYLGLSMATTESLLRNAGGEGARVRPWRELAVAAALTVLGIALVWAVVRVVG